MWSLLNSSLLLLDEAVTVALLLNIHRKHRWKFLVCSKSRSKMAKTAISGQRKSCVSFSFFFFFFLLIHFSNKKQTYVVLHQGCLLFLPTVCFKTPGCSYYCFGTAVKQWGSVRRKAPWFLRAGGEAQTTSSSSSACLSSLWLFSPHSF